MGVLPVQQPLAQQPASGPVVIPIDTNHDGQLDSILLDTTGDGRPDTLIPTAPRPMPAPVPVFAGTIVSPPVTGHAKAYFVPAQPSQDTQKEETSIVELVRTPLGLGLSIDGQNKVTAIAHGSQAERSGLFAVHDRLISLNGQTLSGSSPLGELLGAISLGGKVSIEIARRS